MTSVNETLNTKYKKNLNKHESELQNASEFLAFKSTKKDKAMIRSIDSTMI